MSPGTVYLVGGGPGDPGLLTVKAQRLLARADVVVYDNLVGDAIIDRIPPSAERVYAGKETGVHTMNQDAINALLEERARQGQTVVRLKGGDPFLFGRGGEEAEYLSARGIPFEVVPGVSSALAVPAYAGIPVTHRRVAASVAVATGRAGPLGEAPEVEWGRIAGADTLVVLMGVANLESLVRTLIDSGRDPSTPAAAIRWGTTAQQRTVVATLGTIAERVRAAGLRPPATLVVGEVVALLPRMRWAEARPLFGHRVLVPAAHPSPLTEPLERLGAEVLHAAPFEFQRAASSAPLDGALAVLGGFTGLLFADVPGVEAFFARLDEREADTRLLAGRRVLATGATTARALRAHGVRADSVIDDDELAGTALAGAGGRWLIVGTDEAAAALATLVERAGAAWEAPAVCAATVTKGGADRLRELLAARRVHTIAFLHPSEVRGMLAALDAAERAALAGLTLAAGDAMTARALRAWQLEPAIVVSGGAPALAEMLAAAVTARGLHG